MNKLYICLLLAVMVSCKGEMKSDGAYGDAVQASAAITVPQLLEAMKTQTAMEATVQGKVKEVCKSEGCWLTLENANGDEFFIDIKDKKFHLTSTLEGKEVIVKGSVSKESISVEEQQQMAREDNKTADEIAAITAPKEDIAMEATGLMVKK